MPSAPLTGKCLVTPWNYGDATLFNGLPGTVVAGGSWLSSMPVSCVQTRLLADKARSADLQPTSTKFTVTLDKQRMIQLVALLNHNLTSTAQVRVSGYYDAGLTQPYPNADRGWLDAWPPYAPISQLGPEDANWLTGRPTREDLDRMPTVWFTTFPMAHNVQFWLVEINDQANPAGYVDVGRIYFSPVLQFSVNFAFGSTFGWNTETTYQRSKGGTKFFDTMPSYRVAQLNFPYLKKDEAFYALMKMKQRLGKDKEFLVSMFPGDLQYRQLFTFQCNFEDLQPMTFQQYLRQSDTFNIQEAL